MNFETQLEAQTQPQTSTDSRPVSRIVKILKTYFAKHAGKTCCFCIDLRQGSFLISGATFAQLLWQTVNNPLAAPLATYYAIYNILSTFIVLFGVKAIFAGDVKQVRLYTIWYLLNSAFNIALAATLIANAPDSIPKFMATCLKTISNHPEDGPIDCHAFASSMVNTTIVSQSLTISVVIYFALMMAQFGFTFQKDTMTRWNLDPGFVVEPIVDPIPLESLPVYTPPYTKPSVDTSTPPSYAVHS